MQTDIIASGLHARGHSVTYAAVDGSASDYGTPYDVRHLGRPFGSRLRDVMRDVAPDVLLVGMGVWEYFSPGGNPRVGVLRFETTRGDRLFISLLGSAFIHLAWLGLVSPELWWALALSLVYAFCVFRFV